MTMPIPDDAARAIILEPLHACMMIPLIDSIVKADCRYASSRKSHQEKEDYRCTVRVVPHKTYAWPPLKFYISIR